MSAYRNILAGVGSIVGGGFVKFIEAVPIQVNNNATTTVSMHPLGFVLIGLGMILVSYGIVEDFALKHLKKRAEREEAADDAAAKG